MQSLAATENNRKSKKNHTIIKQHKKKEIAGIPEPEINSVPKTNTGAGMNTSEVQATRHALTSNKISHGSVHSLYECVSCRVRGINGGGLIYGDDSCIRKTIPQVEKYRKIVETNL